MLAFHINLGQQVRSRSCGKKYGTFEMNKMNEKIWTTKEGKKIRISILEDRHLMNIIKLIERQYARTIGSYLVGPQPRGEMAQDAFDQEFDALDQGGPSEFNEQYDFLVEEAEKRKLVNRKARENRLMNLDLVVLSIVVGK